MRIARYFLMVPVMWAVAAAWGGELTPKERLGELLFFDRNLSTPPGQSCAACHARQVGFTGPDSAINEAGSVYAGAVHTRFGNRKPPTAAYGGDSPVMYYDEDEGLWIGGMFWDGRATGWTLGDPLAEQALGPFLNDLEQNMPHAKQVVNAVAKSKYAALFRQVWGPNSLDPVKDVAGSYERIGRSIAAFERSSKVNPYTSKYDYFLMGQAQLDTQEAWGLELFNGKGMCSLCHLSEPERDSQGNIVKLPLFTDFTYDNLGLPKNPANPFYHAPRKWNPDGINWVDPGLGGFLKSAGFDEDVYAPEWGKHRVPTLRNVDLRPSSDLVKAFGHNGYFKSLKEIVHFYNMRDVSDEWPEPEYAETMNTEELGDLGLTDEEEDAIVAFMKTLSDGYRPPQP